MSTSRKKTGRPAHSRDDHGLRKAIDAAGSVTLLAECLGLSVQAVSQWDKIPIERCGDIERLTGVPRHVQRPDIFVRPSRREMSRAA
jgi:DNA-binding transcriptional regulator YdaS (Cro superfamily)